MDKRRAENLSSSDRATVIELAEKYWNVIENKKTDNTTVMQKASAWQQLTTDYNSCSTNKRTPQQLKQAYENIKKKAKKAAAQDRVQTLKTGGGKYSPTMDEIDIKVVNMLGNRATPLVNQYDCSAEYLSQSVVSIMAPQPTPSTSEGVVYHCVEIPTDLMTTTTTTVSETTAAEAVGLSAAAAAVPPAPGVDQKKWAGRRRPALKTSKCDVRTETTSKIGQLAEEKKNYIQEKLKRGRLNIA